MTAHYAGLEDGTLGFLNIIALKHGFRQLQQLGGMQVRPQLKPTQWHQHLFTKALEDAVQHYITAC